MVDLWLRSGEQDYSIALKLIKYLNQEKEYLPGKVAFSALKKIAQIFRRTSQYGPFKVCVFDRNV